MEENDVNNNSVPKPGDVVTGPVVDSARNISPQGNLRITIPAGVLPPNARWEDVVPILVDGAQVAAIEFNKEGPSDPVKQSQPGPGIVVPPDHEPSPGPSEVYDPVADPDSTYYPSSHNDGKEDGREKKPTIIGCLLPTLTGIALALSLKACVDSRSEDKYVREIVTREETPISVVYDVDINGPQDNVTGVTGMKGQEGLTNNAIEGEATEGTYYSGTQHFEDERDSAEGLDEFRESQEQVASSLERLGNDGLSQDEMSNLVHTAEEETRSMEAQYADREELIADGVQEFRDQTMVNADSNSEIEIQAVEEMKNTFDREHRQVEENLEGIHGLAEEIDSGKEIHISSVGFDERSGQYTITGESIKEVTELQEYTGIRATWERFIDRVSDFFKFLGSKQSSPTPPHSNTSSKDDDLNR